MIMPFRRYLGPNYERPTPEGNSRLFRTTEKSMDRGVILEFPKDQILFLLRAESALDPGPGERDQWEVSAAVVSIADILIRPPL